MFAKCTKYILSWDLVPTSLNLTRSKCSWHLSRLKSNLDLYNSSIIYSLMEKIETNGCIRKQMVNVLPYRLSVIPPHRKSCIKQKQKKKHNPATISKSNQDLHMGDINLWAQLQNYFFAINHLLHIYAPYV